MYLRYHALGLLALALPKLGGGKKENSLKLTNIAHENRPFAPKGDFIFQPLIFRGYVSFREGIYVRYGHVTALSLSKWRFTFRVFQQLCDWMTAVLLWLKHHSTPPKRLGWYLKVIIGKDLPNDPERQYCWWKKSCTSWGTGSLSHCLQCFFLHPNGGDRRISEPSTVWASFKIFWRSRVSLTPFFCGWRNSPRQACELSDKQADGILQVTLGGSYSDPSRPHLQCSSPSGWGISLPSGRYCIVASD